MFAKKRLYIFALVIVLIWTYYVFMNKDKFIREHLTDTPSTVSVSRRPPTTYAIESQLKKTDAKIDALQAEFKKMNDQMEAQSQQAAAAKASLDAISTGYNDVIPVRT